MNLLITGTAGFIGARTAQLALDAGHQVIGLDNLNDYYDVRLKHHRLQHLLQSDGFQFHEIDIEDADAFDRITASTGPESSLLLHAGRGEKRGLTPFRYEVVRAQGAGDRGQKSEARSQAESSLSSSAIQKSKIPNHQSAISSSSQTLTFDHTIFREGGGLTALAPPIHSFRSVWVAGLSGADARTGLDGDEFDHLRTIRLKSALTRFRPEHARVIQGAVRGAPNAEAAWQAFEHAMLKDLSFR